MQQDPDPPICEHCNRAMRYLCPIPLEEPGKPKSRLYWVCFREGCGKGSTTTMLPEYDEFNRKRDM